MALALGELQYLRWRTHTPTHSGPEAPEVEGYRETQRGEEGEGETQMNRKDRRATRDKEEGGLSTGWKVAWGQVCNGNQICVLEAALTSTASVGGSRTHGRLEGLAVSTPFIFVLLKSAEIAEKPLGPAFAQFQQLLIKGQCEREGAVNTIKLGVGTFVIVCLGRRKKKKMYSCPLVHNQNSQLQKWLWKKWNNAAVFVTVYPLKFCCFF